MRSRHRLLGALGAIAIAFVLAAPVAADTTPGGGNGTEAFAVLDGGCTDNNDGTATCSSTQLQAFKAKTGGSDTVCYDDFIGTFDWDTGDTITSHESFGCADNPGTVTVNKLDSVDLASTDIDLTTVDCNPDCTDSDGGTLAVEATWTGVGKTLKSSFSNHTRDPFCVEVDRGKSTSRNATFDGPFDASFAGISVGTSSFRIRCK
jgi:hypothetical protein